MTHISIALETIICGIEQNDADRNFGVASGHDYDGIHDDGTPFEDICEADILDLEVLN